MLPPFRLTKRGPRKIPVSKIFRQKKNFLPGGKNDPLPIAHNPRSSYPRPPCERPRIFRYRRAHSAKLARFMGRRSNRTM